MLSTVSLLRLFLQDQLCIFVNVTCSGYSINNGDSTCSSSIHGLVSSDGRLWARQSTTEISVHSITYLSDYYSKNFTRFTQTPVVITVSTQTWAYAPTIEVKWRASDTKVLSLIPKQTSSTKRNHLSSPEIAGLVIGLTLVMLSLGILIVIWRIRRRRLREEKHKEDQWQKPELQSREIPLRALKVENDPIENEPVELPVRPISPVELPSDSRPEKFTVQID